MRRCCTISVRPYAIQALDGFAVAPRAPGFLIIGFDAFRQIEMRHEAHVRFIDAHAERNGGDDHDAVLVDEAILMAGTQAGVQACMVGQRLDAGLAQRGRRRLRPWRATGNRRCRRRRNGAR